MRPGGHSIRVHKRPGWQCYYHDLAATWQAEVGVHQAPSMSIVRGPWSCRVRSWNHRGRHDNFAFYTLRVLGSVLQVLHRRGRNGGWRSEDLENCCKLSRHGESEEQDQTGDGGSWTDYETNAMGPLCMMEWAMLNNRIKRSLQFQNG